MAGDKFLASSSIALVVLAVLLLFAVLENAFAQPLNYCDVGGKKVITDRSCEALGGKTRYVRGADSFTPLSGGGGLTDGERQLAQQYIQRDAMDSQQRHAQITQRDQQTRNEDVQNDSVCRRLDEEKQRIVAQLRQNSTQWLNDRHRAVNDELYRRRCKTL